MNELTKQQVQYGHQKIEILSKKFNLSTGEIIMVLKRIKELNNFWHWDKADEYLDYLEEVERECEQRLMEKNNKLSLER